MRDPKRISDMEISITRLWRLLPDWRLGQLLSNVAHSHGWRNNDLFYLEDDELEKALDEFYYKTLAQIKESSHSPLCEDCDPINFPQCHRCIGC